jgi:hypothetical protein
MSLIYGLACTAGGALPARSYEQGSALHGVRRARRFYNSDDPPEALHDLEDWTRDDLERAYLHSVGTRPQGLGRKSMCKAIRESARESDVRTSAVEPAGSPKSSGATP